MKTTSMADFVKMFLSVLLITCWLQPIMSQNCMKFSASPCEGGTSGESPTNVQGLPGKRGPTGHTGPPGEKGDRGSPAKDHMNRINELENEIEKLQRKSTATETKLDEALRNITDLQSHIISLQTFADNFRYTIAKTPRAGTYGETRQMCISMGGDLLQKCLSRHVHGVNYERQVQATVDAEPVINPHALWIGINDIEEEGRWKYLSGKDFNGHPDDGEDLLYFWAKGQPQDAEDCGAIYVQTLHDCSCHRVFYGICEIPHF